MLPIPFETVRRSMQSSAESTQELEQAHKQIAGAYKVDAADRNALDVGIQLHNSLKRLSMEQKLDGFATECWSGFPRELGLNPCLGFSEDAYALLKEAKLMKTSAWGCFFAASSVVG